ncbi:MAG TPA: hypothetical protein VE088_06245, partial [Gaiellaceae bacterium]|nr:hypothetical protein [Gaiellaceae bacterium]
LPTPPLINAALVAPSSGRDAVLARQVRTPLLRTTDGGRAWRRVHEPGRAVGYSWIVFSTRRVGVAVVQVHDSALADAVWRTTDGGAIWHSVSLR